MEEYREYIREIKLDTWSTTTGKHYKWAIYGRTNHTLVSFIEVIGMGYTLEEALVNFVKDLNNKL